MKAVRKICTVGGDGKLVIDFPEGIGKKVEVTIWPLQAESQEYGEWTEAEWQAMSLRGFLVSEDDHNVRWEEFFSVKDG